MLASRWLRELPSEFSILFRSRGQISGQEPDADGSQHDRMTIGVATVLTMIAMGSGAQTAITDQVRAAGMNLIVITAGNYKQKTEEDFQVIENARWERSNTKGMYRSALWFDDGKPRFLKAFHPEDDPFAAARSSDCEAETRRSGGGFGRCGNIEPCGCRRSSQAAGRSVRFRRCSRKCSYYGRRKRWRQKVVFPRLHGDDVSLPEMKRAWKFPKGRFYNKKELDNADQVVVLRIHCRGEVVRCRRSDQ